MPRLPRRIFLASSAVLVAATCLYAQTREWKSGVNWPEPKVVTPGEGMAPPSDATVLFDGKSLDAWKGADGWAVKDGYATPQKGDISTKQEFADCQLHIEFATPDEVKGEGQGRGNSGVFLCGEFEVQVLDSYENKTYFDGQCAGIYKQRPPLVNVCKKPGEWQSYDIVFHAPQFHDDGSVKRPATITVLQNNVLVQDHLELLGDTPFVRAPQYHPRMAKGPIKLQNHGNPVKFRNIWIRELSAPQI
jgi:hypothetical protein